MKLFDYAESFEELFNSLDAISDYEPQKNEEGEYIDDDGNIIDDLAAVKADMLQAWYDTLDGIEEGFEAKAENIACYLKQLSGELEMLKQQKAAFERRRKSKENQIEGLQNYLIRCMEKINRKSIDAPKAKITVKLNPEAAEVIDEALFIKWAAANAPEYLRPKDPDINKTKLKTDLKLGKEIPLAELKRKKSLTIK